MKLKSLVFLGLFFFIKSIDAQLNSVEVLYRINPQITDEQKEAKINSLPIGLKTQLKDMLLLRDSLIFGLTINGSESVFYLDLNKVSKYSKLKGYNSTIQSFGSSYFFKSSDTKEILENKIEDKNYLISSKQTKFNWTLHNESKKIGDYLCFKASTIKNGKDLRGYHKKDVIAWYCPELSFSTGPKDYGNLPGLILELKEGDLIYYAIEVNFRDKLRKFKKPSRGKRMTEKEYFETIPTMTRHHCFIR